MGMRLVKFSAEWCRPCKMMAPHWHNVEKKFNDVIFESVDIDKDAELALDYKIMSVPTVLVFVDDRLVDSVVGLQTEKDLSDLIENYK